jgi:hypothetical protein
MLKGTQRRVAVAAVAFTAITPAALMLVERPASAFPPGHSVYSFKDQFLASTRVAKLKQTIAPGAGTFIGGIDLVTGQLKGDIKLPNVTFANQLAGLGSATAQIAQVKPVTGHMNTSNNQVTATATFVIRIVKAYAASAAAPHAVRAAALPPVTLPPVTLPPLTLPTLPITLPTLPITLPTLPFTLPTVPSGVPPVNLVGNNCVTATPITAVLHGVQHMGAASKFLGSFTMPKFKGCGGLTSLLNKDVAGPGNTFAATSAPPGIPLPTLPSLPITLPSLPITLPSLPITLPTLPVTIPTLPVTIPTLPTTLPTLPITIPTLPITIPTLPITIPTLP